MTSRPTRPPATGTTSACAGTHWLAVACANSVLERNGNAFDAAVAGGFVLHLAEPHLNGPGGDLVAVFAEADTEPTVLVGQGVAPAGASIEHFEALGLDAVPGAGALAAAVPGAFDAWLLLLRDHGTWSFESVVEYALHYAVRGCPVSGQTSEAISKAAETFRRFWPSSAAQWTPAGRTPRAGELITFPAWAAVLSRLVAVEREAGTAGRARGIDAVRAEWRSGFVARAIDDFVRDTPHWHSDGRVHHGVLSIDDMQSWSASYEDPVALDFHGFRVHKAGGWSQGPVLLEALALLDLVAPDFIGLEHESGIHIVAEILKLAMADRDAHLGDADGPTNAVARLLERGYLQRRAGLVTGTASHDFRPGALPGGSWTPPLRVAGQATSSVLGEPTVRTPTVIEGDTCHLDVVDRWGNLVSVTPSGGWLQSSPSIPRLGFSLGTRLQMTWLDRSSPSRLLAGTRPRTTLSPTLLTRHGRAAGVLGTPGGDQQDQWQMQFLVHHIVGGLDVRQAIEVPYFHTSSFPSSFAPRAWDPGALWIESRRNAEVVEALHARGHNVRTAGAWSLGRLSAVLVDANGEISAAANPRGGLGHAIAR